MKIPEQIPIMTLPNAILFPQALLPLYIFEPRYRSMLKKSLNEQRMFAIAMPGAHTRPRSIGGIGLIRACVDRPDGTSNLILQGVSRVRFTDFVQKDPYYVGRIEVLHTQDNDGKEVEKLAAKVVAKINKLHSTDQLDNDAIIKFLNELEDYEAMADIITYSFIEDVKRKQSILEELDLARRLKKVLLALNQLNDESVF
jgi:Lon protease-like protein